jgi:hypothetical protein
MWKICCFSITNVHESIFIKTSILNTNIIILNIGLHVKNQNWGFYVGEFIDTNLLNSPLLSWDGVLDKNISREKLSNIFLFILLQNLRNNPMV